MVLASFAFASFAFASYDFASIAYASFALACFVFENLLLRAFANTLPRVFKTVLLS